MRKAAILFTLIVLPLFSFAQNINKTKDDVTAALAEYSKTIKDDKLNDLKNTLEISNLTPGDEWGDFSADSPRYSMIVGENLVFKIDIDANINKVVTVWLLYPRNAELSPEVIAMKKAVAYVVNKDIYTNKKFNSQYTKFMNKPRDSKGKANFKRIDGYTFMNTICSDAQFCITAEDD